MLHAGVDPKPAGFNITSGFLPGVIIAKKLPMVPEDNIGFTGNIQGEAVSPTRVQYVCDLSALCTRLSVRHPLSITIMLFILPQCRIMKHAVLNLKMSMPLTFRRSQGCIK